MAASAMDRRPILIAARAPARDSAWDLARATLLGGGLHIDLETHRQQVQVDQRVGAGNRHGRLHGSIAQRSGCVNK